MAYRPCGSFSLFIARSEPLMPPTSNLRPHAFAGTRMQLSPRLLSCATGEACAANVHGLKSQQIANEALQSDVSPSPIQLPTKSSAQQQLSSMHVNIIMPTSHVRQQSSARVSVTTDMSLRYRICTCQQTKISHMTY